MHNEDVDPGYDREFKYYEYDLRMNQSVIVRPCERGVNEREEEEGDHPTMVHGPPTLPTSKKPKLKSGYAANTRLYTTRLELVPMYEIVPPEMKKGVIAETFYPN